ncbi:G2/mitotic-specific cyclin S13-6 [Gracilariopsis chorda]|uniref:G2/mitotic-specific cyclin S13-6 n=1 Tax=Gracilariopsis chorda TaxID=448386 RepID=A0A2V3IZ93_9FLOR|nr:G2/mitotic-specific cyclin S13-6 [Gracilariopsis chorda]|eukprot:PXF46450.1 G2/mitotic-specific cyclin S13-6 [Gracilariopsis chorda]
MSTLLFNKSRPFGDITNRPLSNPINNKHVKKPAPQHHAFKPLSANKKVRVHKTPVVQKSITKPNYIDIDAADKANHVEASDFAAIIHTNNLLAERTHIPCSNYIKTHETITPKMRSILVDWLADVCVTLKLCDKTFHLCIHILDRYLEKHQPTVKTLQLVGSVCLYIAAKYEEIYAPHANDLSVLSAGAFTMADVFTMEAHILNALQFQVTTPYTLTFFARIEKTLFAKGITPLVAHKISSTAQFIAELAMVDGLHLNYRPSQLAAAAVHLAVNHLNVPISWCESLSFHSGWQRCELHSCALKLKELVCGAKYPKNGRFTAIHRKFSATSTLMCTQI